LINFVEETTVDSHPISHLSSLGLFLNFFCSPILSWSSGKVVDLRRDGHIKLGLFDEELPVEKGVAFNVPFYLFYFVSFFLLVVVWGFFSSSFSSPVSHKFLLRVIWLHGVWKLQYPSIKLEITTETSRSELEELRIIWNIKLKLICCCCWYLGVFKSIFIYCRIGHKRKTDKKERKKEGKNKER